MPLVIGVVILLVLLWAAKRSRARGILNIAQQRLGGAVAILVAALLLVRGDWGIGLGLGLFGMYLLGQVLPWPLSSLAGQFDGAATSGREHMQADADTGLGMRPAPSSKMTEQEAYQVLGVARGATVTEISRAHRSLMSARHAASAVDLSNPAKRAR
jgi:hypothetical protein